MMTERDWSGVFRSLRTLDVCPWCGEPLNWHETHKTEWLSDEEAAS